MSVSGSLVTVVIADDHPFFRDGVKRALDNSGHIQVVGEAGDGRQALEMIRAEQPVVALVDYQMPELNGIDVVHAVIRDHLPTRVILLSAFTDSAVVFKSLEEGAAGYLAKDTPRGEIVDAVLRVAKGQTVVPAELAGGLADQIRLRAKSNTPVLSDRERQVLAAFARGLSIPQTSAELFLGVATIKTYAQRLYEKLGVSDRAAAVAEAMRRGLID
ncbi:response regulator transcription factor [Leekyejoonella antrihumi]|uniref:Response regulator transcription factor n=1 Tax=Leekyejoonella antrihumi TaxID=1660198 RepID=A0A563DSA6_9MICO|nr:response regulator transcription factor [Leekyejoonella antrihumi]TWP32863.1 response regulator transcription factor [Leekyejoonella antrihumi]